MSLLNFQLKKVGLFFIFLFLIINISAIDRFQQYQNATIEVPSYENDLSKCTSCSCEININDPDGVLVIDSASMTPNNNRMAYNISGIYLNKLGTYEYDVYCSNGVDYGGGNGFFDVTTTKRELSSGESVIYFIVFGFILMLFFLSMYFSFAIPYSNQTNMQGAIVQVTKKKYIKLFFIGLTYGLFLWVINFFIGISDNFIGLGIFYNFLTVIFNALLVTAIPFLIVLIILFLFELVKDINLKKQLNSWGQIR